MKKRKILPFFCWTELYYNILIILSSGDGESMETINEEMLEDNIIRTPHSWYNYPELILALS